MERSKYIIALAIVFISVVQLKASYKADIYNAYISSNMGKWKKVIDEMNQQKIKSNEFVLELLNYQYGYIAWCIGNDKDKLAEQYLELGFENLEKLEKSAYKLSMVNAYKSAFYGYRIGINPFKAPFIGPKSIECAKLSIKQDEKNPFGYIQFGNAQFYMPAIFGGSKTVAIEYFSKAEKLMEIDAESIKFDWNYLSLVALIGQAYSETKQYNKAKEYFDKILIVEPNYLWVKDELYPELLKKIN